MMPKLIGNDLIEMHSVEFDSLTQQVRTLLFGILHQATFPGSDELRCQVASVKVVDGPMTMLDLQVQEMISTSAVKNGPIPLSAIVSDASGMAIGELLIWVKDGWLSTLEFAWWEDNPPNQLPSLDQVRVTER
jgi:hypothetical protein